jgi:hypothetical protein
MDVEGHVLLKGAYPLIFYEYVRVIDVDPIRHAQKPPDDAQQLTE